MNKYVTASEFFGSLEPDERVILLLRHGERRHITPADTDSGAHVGLTDRGRQQGYDLGVAIGPGVAGSVYHDAVYFSSPVGRCVETAQRIGQGRESAGAPAAPEVKVLDCLGDYFVQDYDEYLKTLNENFYPNICQWISAGEHPAFYPLADRAEEMFRMMLQKMDDPASYAEFNLQKPPRYGIFCSHDAWIVPCLKHFCGFEFTPQQWMNFLSGVAFVLGPSTPDDTTKIAASAVCKRLVPITALADGNLYF